MPPGSFVGIYVTDRGETMFAGRKRAEAKSRTVAATRSGGFQFFEIALEHTDMVQCIVAAVRPQIARAKADVAGRLHRRLHAVRGRIRKRIGRRNMNDGAFLPPDVS